MSITLSDSGCENFLALPLLPASDIGDAYAFDIDATRPDDDTDAIDKFADYIVSTYIDDDALFPPYVWAAAPDADMHHLPRTTNACESFHKHLKDGFDSASPNIFLFSAVLCKLQEQIYVDIQSSSATRRYVKPEDKAKHRYVAAAFKQYQDEHISRAEYIAKICHKYLPVDFHRKEDN